jgi:hypothetical protein
MTERTRIRKERKEETHYIYDLAHCARPEPHVLHCPPEVFNTAIEATAELASAVIYLAESCVYVHTADSIQKLMPPKYETALCPYLTRNGRYLLVKTQQNILVWDRQDYERAPWYLKIPKSYRPISKLVFDPTGRYMVASLRKTALGADTRPSSHMTCLALWDTDALYNPKPLATTSIPNDILSLVFAQCNTDTAKMQEHRLFLGITAGQLGTDPKLMAYIWAPGVAPKPFVLPRTVHGLEELVASPQDRVGQAFFSTQPDSPHRFLTRGRAVRAGSVSAFAQVWTLESSGVQRLGPPFYFKSRPPSLLNDYPQTVVGFYKDGLALWKAERVDAWDARGTRRRRNAVTFCTLDQANGTWNEARTWRDAILTPDFGLILQAQTDGTCHIWRT